MGIFVPLTDQPFFAAEVSHDRSTAHFAAWYSPKREAQQMGQKFQPEASGDG
jgi:hypothetical protein